jgi:transcriptional regulator with XRE-family HTH domain
MGERLVEERVSRTRSYREGVGTMSEQTAGMRLGPRLRELRKSMPGPPSIESVARDLGWSNSKLRNFEAARSTMPEPEDLKKLADYYGVSFDHLVFVAGYRADDPSSGARSQHALASQSSFSHVNR